MAIELHHLNTNGMMEQAGKVLDGVVRLKARIAELEEERRWRKFPVSDGLSARSEARRGSSRRMRPRWR